MLTLIAVEVHLNREALSLFTISATAGAEHFNEHLRVQAWKDARVRIAELMNNVDHYDKIAVYYEDVEWANDLIYRSDLPQTRPHEVSVDFWALLRLRACANRRVAYVARSSKKAIESLLPLSSTKSCQPIGAASK
jgi:hypothetical protein